MRDNRKSFPTWLNLFLAACLLTASAISFYIFTVDNRKRILEMNETYIGDITLQTTNRLENLLHERKTNLDILTLTVMETITEPKVDQDLLLLLQDASSFDYVEFIDANGRNHNAKGQQSDSRDRESYLKGMKGHTGTTVIFNSRMTHETLICFYSPISFDGEIIGVLCGMYREVSIQQAISTTMFDVTAKTYLCQKDGTVITFTGDSNAPSNILEGLETASLVTPEDLAAIRNAFETHTTYNYTYQGTQGTGNASLTPLTGYDWLLLQTFPSTLTKNMVDHANEAGVRLETTLLIIFLFYLTFLIVRNILQRRRLLSEKTRLTWIIEGIIPLFSRLVMLDYENGTYEYLENTQPDIPAKGTLETLEKYMNARYISEDVATPVLSPLSCKTVQKQLKTNVPYLQFEYRIQWEKERWENASIMCLRRNNSVPTLVLCAIQDVTPLKEQEQQTRQILQNAFHAAENANHAKNNFLARMSHDMRTPMNAIMGMASIAQMHLDSSERIQDCLEKITLASRHLLSLINDVLDMTKIESDRVLLNEENFHLPTLIEQTLAVIRPLASDKEQTFEEDVSPFDHENVSGDATRFQQVLVNILDNAVKYTHKQGRVRFQAREVPSRIADSACYEFVIEDNGIGMEPDFIPEIFEPFARSQTSQSQRIEGTGLGMPIARTLVRMMNGSIHVESQLNKGSCFTVQLYLKIQTSDVNELLPPTDAPEISSVSEKDKLAQCQARYAGVRVLLVEDNELNTEIAMEMLDMAGVEVETACDGQEAVDQVKNHPLFYYSLILMDIQMPNKNGYEATKEIRSLEREDARQVPIVAMSANAFIDDVRQAKESGMNDHVAKPVDLDKILDTLNKWLPLR